MKKLFKGIAVCSLGLLLGKGLIGTNNYYEVKNDVKLLKTGLSYSEGSCVKLEDTVMNSTTGQLVKIGDVEAILRYKDGDVVIEICKNPDLELRTYDCSDDEIFEGWYYDKELTQKVEGTTIGDAMGSTPIEITYHDGSTVCLKSYNYITEVYAKCSKVPNIPTPPDCEYRWQTNYYVDGQLVKSDTSNESSYCTSYDIVNSYQPAAKAGYTFDGWYTDADFKNKIENDGKNFCQSAAYGGACPQEVYNYYGKWVKNNTNCSNDVDKMINVSYIIDGEVYDTKRIDATEKFDTAAPTKDGYKFDGWYIDKDLKTKLGDTVNIESVYDANNCLIAYKDISFYGKWINIDNPHTGDNIILYVTLGIVLLAGGIVVTKKLTNK